MIQMPEQRSLYKASLLLMFAAVAILLLVALSMGSENTEAKTITVNATGTEDYTTIQDAIDNAEDDDIIMVREGIYVENVVVSKTLSLLGNGSGSTTIDGGGNGDVVTVSADRVSLSGFTITNSSNQSSGVFSSKDHGSFEALKVTGNRHGIYLLNAQENTIGYCDVSTNTKVGVRLEFSNKTIITRNSLKRNEDGVSLYASSSNHILENAIQENTDDGIDIDPGSTFNHVANNTVVGNPFGIICTTAPNNTIVDNTVQYNGYFGIGLYLDSHDSTITGNTASLNSGFGIAIHASNNSLISGNIIGQNGIVSPVPVGGIYANLSRNTTISFNSITSNKGYGIYLENATDYTILYCTIADNEDGINVTEESRNTRVSRSNINNNENSGLISTGVDGITVNATGNWWGNESGPYHPVNNSAGEGNGVTDYVDFDDWLSGPSALVRKGDDIKLHYISYLLDGTLVDASFKQLEDSSLPKWVDFDPRNATEPLDLKVGAGTVVKGFDEGVRGMNVGENRTIIVPPEKGYTSVSHALYGTIVMFDVFIVDVEGTVVEWVDEDSDGDGFPDDMDWAPSDENEWWDHDGDGIGDNADTDDDNDGFTDTEEIESGSNPFDKEDVPSGRTGTVSSKGGPLTVTRGGIEKGLSAGDELFSGDILVSEKTAVLEFSSDDILPTPKWEGDLYILMGPYSKIGIVYLDNELYITGFYGVYYVYIKGDDSRGRTRQVRGDGPPTLTTLNHDPLIDSILAEDHYPVHTRIGDVDESTFFRIEVDSNFATIQTYEGSTSFEGTDSTPRTVDEHHGGTIDHQSGEIADQDFTAFIGVTAGDVETDYGDRLENLGEGYHIPGLEQTFITVVSEADYSVDVPDSVLFSGGSDTDYSFQWTTFDDGKKKEFEVRTTLGEGEEDSFLVYNSAKTGFESSEEKDYDLAINYETDDSSETFEIFEIRASPEKEGTFKVTDFSKLDDPSKQPVSYTTNGPTVKISTGEKGDEIQERWEEEDKKKNEEEGIQDMVIGYLTDVYFYVPNYYFVALVLVLLVVKRSRKKKKRAKEEQVAQEQKTSEPSFAEKFPQFAQASPQTKQPATPQQPFQPPQSPQPQQIPSDGWPCPQCGKVVKGGFNFCMFCGGKRNA